MSSTFSLFAACQPGVEPLLAGELRALGAAPQELAGGVAFAGELRLAMRAALWLGAASHLSLRLAEFRCRAPGELERKAKELPWRAWLRSDVPLALRASSRASRVYHTGLIAERVRSAIEATLGAAPPAAASADAPAARVQARFERDVCTLSLEATSTPLHRRGYRLDGAKAPLREDLAHALVLASGFTPELALLDPFCGSGTIAIEAAGIALGLAPARLRPPPLEHLALFDASAWRDASAPRAARQAAPIAASDRDAGAIAAARANAERAGAASAINFTHCALTKQPWLAQPGAAPERGVLVTNPPFGRRISESRKLETLYQALGHRAGRLPAGWRIALLAHDVRLARRTGLALHAGFTTKHGGLSVTALVGDVRAPEQTA
ncbi:MAG: class I SAM-dependent RNA methyltransferase [Myxococcota bacterium]|jgi:putative N6-adenine-specific DNA methylase